MRTTTTTYTPPDAPTGWYRFEKATRTPCRRCYTSICRIEGPLRGFVRGFCRGCGMPLPRDGNAYFYDTDALLEAWEAENNP